MSKLIKIFAVLALIAVVAVVGIIMTVDINQYKGDIVQLVTEQTGREFQIDGDLKIAPSLIPTIAVSGVSLGNVSWATSKKPMLSVGKFEAQVALIPLLKKKIQLKKLILLKPVISLETNKKGEGNWVLESGKKEEKAEKTDAEPLPDLNLQKILIEDANLSYKDGKTGEETILVVDTIQTESSSLDAPLSLLIKATLNDAPIALEGSLGSVNSLIGNKEFPLNISGTVDKATISVDGKIKQPQSLKGLDIKIGFAVEALSDLARIAGSDLPDAGPISLTGVINDVDGGYSIKAMTAKIMEHEVKGDASVSTAGKRPVITANLAAEKLDLSAFSGEEEKAVKKDKVFSSDPLPLDGLKAADANLKFTTKQLITSSLTMDKVNLNIKLKNGKLDIAPLSGNYAGGKLTANVTLDASQGKTATLSEDITLKQIELGQIPQLKEKKLLTGGKTDVTIKSKGSGASVSAIMAGLNGNILINTGAGKISNEAIDEAGAGVVLSAFDMLNPMAEKEKHTAMECFVIKFDIKDGIAKTDKGIALQTTNVNVVGSGTIDLKTEKLDLGVKPQARENTGISLGSLVSMVRIAGTLAEPAPGVDAAGALTAGVSAGAAVATGGLSLLAQGLLSEDTADSNPCDIALGKAPKKTAKPVEEKSTPAKAVDTVKDSATGVIKGLKGLFD